MSANCLGDFTAYVRTTEVTVFKDNGFTAVLKEAFLNKYMPSAPRLPTPRPS
ncbi:MAG TPA: hypothetical protein VLB82_09685 [Thermodesulfobacteriota bacterium]|nr:hypothetical protein [Thermodesulfobacteriota bacterium]